MKLGLGFRLGYRVIIDPRKNISLVDLVLGLGKYLNLGRLLDIALCASSWDNFLNPVNGESIFFWMATSESFMCSGFHFMHLSIKIQKGPLLFLGPQVYTQCNWPKQTSGPSIQSPYSPIADFMRKIYRPKSTSSLSRFCVHCKWPIDW